jgi:tRNA 2-thiouridine synthesizing protein A
MIEAGRGEALVVDVRGLKCPLPALKTARRMRSYSSGTRFVVHATDPMAAIDIPNFCREEGHRLLASSNDSGVLRFEIEKG